MTAETVLAACSLSTPELILAVGAMVLLMIGVFSGERSTGLVTGLAVAPAGRRRRLDRCC